MSVIIIKYPFHSLLTCHKFKGNYNDYQEWTVIKSSPWFPIPQIFTKNFFNQLSIYLYTTSHYFYPVILLCFLIVYLHENCTLQNTDYILRCLLLSIPLNDKWYENMSSICFVTFCIPMCYIVSNIEGLITVTLLLIKVIVF